MSVLESALRQTPSPLEGVLPRRASLGSQGILSPPEAPPMGLAGGRDSSPDTPTAPPATTLTAAALPPAAPARAGFSPSPVPVAPSPLQLGASPSFFATRSPSFTGTGADRQSPGFCGKLTFGRSPSLGRSPSYGASPRMGLPSPNTPTWPPPEHLAGGGGTMQGSPACGGTPGAQWGQAMQWQTSSPMACPEAPRPNKTLAARMRAASLSRSSSGFSGSGSYTSQDGSEGSGDGGGPASQRVAFSSLQRQNSLTETKLLVTTRAKKLTRTQSIFQYEDQFHSYELIGRGSFSEVYRARHRLDNELYAVKRTIREFRNRAERDSYQHEVEAVSELPLHPNVVTYFRGWQQGNHLWMQMEYVAYGSLSSVVQRLKPQELPLAAAWGVVREVAAGLAFCHVNGILHLDIKPDNIFVDLNGVAKLGDFGLAVLRSLWGWEDGDGGYLAPELLALDHSTVQPTPAVDVFSLGVVMYELAQHSRLPRETEARAEAMSEALRKAEADAAAEGKEGEGGSRAALLRLAARCLSSDPSERPGAEEIVALCPAAEDGTAAAVMSIRAADALAEAKHTAACMGGMDGVDTPCSPVAAAPAAEPMQQSPLYTSGTVTPVVDGQTPSSGALGSNSRPPIPARGGVASSGHKRSRRSLSAEAKGLGVKRMSLG